MIKSTIISITLLFLGLSLYAQDYRVTRIEYLPDDMTAQNDPKEDENGKPCAILRIVTQNIPEKLINGFYFECDYASYITHKQVQDNEILLWVSPGIKTLKIKHNGLGPFDLHITKYLESAVKSLSVYKITMEGTVQFTAEPEVIETPLTEQYILFQISPKESSITVNGQPWTVSKEGTAKKLVPLGTYEYKAYSTSFYHPQSGTVVLDDPNDTKIVDVKLTSNFGWIEVSGDGNDFAANVYIDGVWIGQTPCKSQSLKSGKHNVRVEKETFKSISKDVEVKDNDITQVSPSLRKKNNFGFFMGDIYFAQAPKYSYGFSFGATKTVGWYFSAKSDFGFSYTNLECNDEDIVYATDQKTSRLSVTAGPVIRAIHPLYFYTGIGYGYRNLFWTIYDSNDVYLAKNIDQSYQGLTFDGGLILNLNGFVLSVGLQTIKFQYIETKASIGFAIRSL